MACRHAAHDAIEQDRFVDRPQRVVAMLERDLELTGRILGHQRAHGQVERSRRAIEIVEQRRHVVETSETVRVDVPMSGLFAQTTCRL